MKEKPKVTVYIPCHNYGRFLGQAIESVVEQNYESWELIILDDGSSDNTGNVIKEYLEKYSAKIRALCNYPARGLQACANLALETARGDYIMRLDADDYLDESALLVLSTYLDRHRDVGLVFPNYTYVNEEGAFLAVENRKKIGTEATFLDLPAHGACTMVRKRVLKSIGGYSETYNAQDGYELWLKVLNRYKVANISTPLFFYRQHSSSLSRDESRILVARQRIKRGLVQGNGGRVKPRIVAVVPAKNTYEKMPDIVLSHLAGRPLIDYTLQAAQETGLFEAVFVTTDDTRVQDYCSQFSGVISSMRSKGLSLSRARLSHVLYDAVTRLEREFEIYPDIVVLLSVHSPLRRSEHIFKAVDTLLLFNSDNVISVYEDYELHFSHGRNGLEPVNKGMIQRLRLEREALYVDNGSIKVFWRDVISESDLYGEKVGHIVMSLEDSFNIKSPFDVWLIENILKRKFENNYAAAPEAMCSQ